MREYIFGGESVVIPGTYARAEADIEQPSLELASGNTLIIDNLFDENYTGGSGVNGEIVSGKDAVRTFTSSRSFQSHVGGGSLWKLAQFLFNPDGQGNGVSSLTYVLAATTTAPSLVLTFNSGGSLTFRSKKEGTAGNGIEVNSKLTRGYAARLVTGSIDSSKYVLQFFQGGYLGSESKISITDKNSNIGGISESASTPQLIIQSPEVSTLQEIVNWAEVDGDLFRFFELTASTPTGSISAADISGLAGNNLFTGGTATSGTADLDAALDSVQDNNIDFVLLLSNAESAASSTNVRIINFFTQEVQNKPSMFVGGYNLASQLTGGAGTSESLAQTFDSELVHLVHGGVVLQNPDNQARTKQYNSIVTSALIMARDAGLEPQIPSTFKSIPVLGLSHNPNRSEQTAAIQNGIMMLKEANGTFEILLDTNTLQNNRFLINQDATSFAGSVVGLKRQIIKEANADLRNVFLKDPDGRNAFTVSPEAVEARLQTFFEIRTAQDGVDNLILSFSDVSATIEGDRILWNARNVLNTPINYIFGTLTITN